MPLTKLTENELDLILGWRNSANTRRVMFTNHEISREEHYEWYRRIKDDPLSLYLIFRDNSNNPKAVVCFKSLDAKQKTAFWGFYCSNDAQPGISCAIELEALDFAFVNLGLRKLNCEVLAFNTAVLNLHRNAGFVQEGIFREHHDDGSNRIDVIRFGIFAAEWTASRPKVLAKVEKFHRIHSAKSD